MIPTELIERCQKIIRLGSKSFAAASLIFNAEDRAAASLLYGWCRYCDDTIDAAGTRDEAVLGEALRGLQEATEKAFANVPQENAVFEAMRHIVVRYQIPRHYAMELLEGMAMDIRRERYETLNDLHLYCYRVAGVVGLMMSHIMGVRSEGALRNAADLGSAMQLTNIARDVYDDAEMGRIYLPMEWLREAGLDPSDILSPVEAPRVAGVVRRLLAEADRLYRSGDEGLRELRFRPACAVAGARYVYAAIGSEVMRRKEYAWAVRVWIPSRKKALLLLKGVLFVLRSVPGRLARPWRPISIATVWRFS
ncbi:MAG: phytoene/squalene synthase family protein [Deltaproteobacteria bacterium]|nr:phytoene/squalene synthase family protein [Deltaproteobacteria bacterium]MBI3293927.1 phytoene/squalene synthase family protein [Deltaproteobacteria bacterium]